MNVLEKILEEIRDNAKLGNMRWESVRIEKVEEIIHSHMSEKEKVSSAEIISRDIDGKPYYGIKYKKVGEHHYTVGYGSYKLDYVINWLNECFEFYGEVKVSVNVDKDTNVLINDDTEEKIREHIAECLHRIDNIRSFIGSKEYTNNDEKCIRNIEVLKTIITALEGYLNSKKKRGNDGWIPVEERLPEKEGRYLAVFRESRGISLLGYGNCQRDIFGKRIGFGWYELCTGNYFAENSIIAWQPLPESYQPEKGGAAG